MAENILNAGEELYCLGEIVHNDEEISRLEQKGMKTITYDEFKKLKNKTVLFRAHGEAPESYAHAHESGIKVVDASCPIILKLQEKIFRSYQAGEQIFLFGKPKHPEIIGLNGKINNSAVVFESIVELENIHLPEKLTLYSQTTKSLRQFYEIIYYLKEKNIDVKVVDSICRQVSGREGDLKKFCSSYDIIIFVSGKNSSNGRQLSDICKQVNRNTYFISSIGEIDISWFVQGAKVGVSGATSTPKWLIEKVKNHLESL